MLSACTGQLTPPQRPAAVELISTAADTGDEPITLMQSGAIVRKSVEELSLEASIIAIGTIRQVSIGRWTTPDGKRPPGPFERGPDSPIILREALFQIEERIKGAADIKELTIYLWGGQVGADKIRVNPEIELQAGDKVLMFLYPAMGPLYGGRPGYRVSGSVQGKYTITGAYAKAMAPPEPILLQDLVARILSAISPP